MFCMHRDFSDGSRIIIDIARARTAPVLSMALPLTVMIALLTPLSVLLHCIVSFVLL